MGGVCSGAAGIADIPTGGVAISDAIVGNAGAAGMGGAGIPLRPPGRFSACHAASNIDAHASPSSHTGSPGGLYSRQLAHTSCTSVNTFSGEAYVP